MIVCAGRRSRDAALHVKRPPPRKGHLNRVSTEPIRLAHRDGEALVGVLQINAREGGCGTPADSAPETSPRLTPADLGLEMVGPAIASADAGEQTMSPSGRTRSLGPLCAERSNGGGKVGAARRWGGLAKSRVQCSVTTSRSGSRDHRIGASIHRVECEKRRRISSRTKNGRGIVAPSAGTLCDAQHRPPLPGTMNRPRNRPRTTRRRRARADRHRRRAARAAFNVTAAASDLTMRGGVAGVEHDHRRLAAPYQPPACAISQPAVTQIVKRPNHSEHRENSHIQVAARAGEPNAEQPSSS